MTKTTNDPQAPARPAAGVVTDREALEALLAHCEVRAERTMAKRSAEWQRRAAALRTALAAPAPAPVGQADRAAPRPTHTRDCASQTVRPDGSRYACDCRVAYTTPRASAPAPDADGAAGVAPWSAEKEELLAWAEAECEQPAPGTCGSIWKAEAEFEGRPLHPMPEHAAQTIRALAAQARAAEAPRFVLTADSKALTETITDLRARLAEAEGERDAAVKWIGCVRDELVIAGYAGGDRDVALANLRALIASRENQRDYLADVEDVVRDCASCEAELLRRADIRDDAARAGGEGRDDGE